MKIILTEAQYELLRMINEVASGFSGAIEKGGYVSVSYMLGDKEQVSIIKITNIYGNGQFIEGANKDGKFLVDLATAFSKENNTFTGLKDGKYIQPQKNAEGKIISAPQISGGSKMIIKNVIKVDISDASKKLVDTVLTDKGEEAVDNGNTDVDGKDLGRSDGEREKEQEETKKEIMKMAMADPTIRKMMYYQPSLLGGLIKIGKAKGISVVKLLNKYGDGDNEDIKNTRKEFLKNKYYEFESVKPISVTHGLKDFRLDAGTAYKAQFDGEKFNGHAGEGKKKVLYSVKLQKKQDNGTYKAVLEVKFKETGKNTPDKIETKKEDIIIKFNK